MAKLLLVLNRLIHYPEKGLPYWVHICWAIYTFVFTVFWWWWEYNLRSVEIWTFGTYMLVMLHAFLIFIFCALQSQSDITSYNGFKGYSTPSDIGTPGDSLSIFLNAEFV
jgi:hypothetical protein